MRRVRYSLATQTLTAQWAVAVMVALASSAVWAAPAHFWISTSNVAPAGPDTTTNIEITEGSVGTLYVWGRAETNKKLRNFSLNIVAMQAGIDFIDASITVYNDAGGGRQRYEYTSDASSTVPLESEETLFDVEVNGQTDAVEAIQGFSISSSSATIRGVGGQCVGAETNCVTAGDGQPAWLIASVDYNAISGGPMTDVHLQIGEHGMNHESLVPGDYDLNGVVDTDDFDEVTDSFSSTVDLWADGNDNGRVDAADYTIWGDNVGSTSVFEVSSLTSVRFGADSGGGDEPIYDASTDRDTTLAMDDPDATITIVPPLQAVESVPEPSCLLLLTVALLCYSPATRVVGSDR